jgi:uncharacterized lipoprotein YbaY
MRTFIPVALAAAFLLAACDKPPPKPPQPIAAVATIPSQIPA